MHVHNTDIAEILYRMADLLEIEGSNEFKVRAYRRAARAVAGLTRSVADMVARGKDLSKLPGIGESLAEKIREIVETGHLSHLKNLEARFPQELTKLTRIPGLGPKRVRVLYERLGVARLEDFKEAARRGKVSELPGFSEKTEQIILEQLKQAEVRVQRIKLIAAREIADSLVNHLEKLGGVKNTAVAGSYRRKKETVGDLDILVTCRNPSKVMEHFVRYENAEKTILKGKSRSSVLLRTGLQVDLRAVPETSYGAALHYFTGSKEHNIAIRKLGIKKGLKINEYGIFEGERRVAGENEEEVYAQVDIPYIEPELRENQGEIEAAQEGQLPTLIRLKDILGDLHIHTNDTDGHEGLEQMARAARKRGYRYIAVTDHSRRIRIAQGLDAKGLAKQIGKIDRLNEKLENVVILKSIEVDILEDGSLDLPDEILQELDLTVCAVHYNTHLSREKQTERIIRAMDNPYFNILAHPTGRLINVREPFEVDMERVLEAARQRGCFLELNAHPDRFDLSDHYCRTAREMGIKIAISTDAHSTDDLEFMRFGVWQARRGWLEAEDVLNTRTWDQLKRLLKRK